MFQANQPGPDRCRPGADSTGRKCHWLPLRSRQCERPYAGRCLGKCQLRAVVQRCDHVAVGASASPPVPLFSWPAQPHLPMEVALLCRHDLPSDTSAPAPTDVDVRERGDLLTPPGPFRPERKPARVHRQLHTASRDLPCDPGLRHRSSRSPLPASSRSRERATKPIRRPLADQATPVGATSPHASQMERA